MKGSNGVWEARNLNPDEFEEWMQKRSHLNIPHPKNPTKLQLPEKFRQFLLDHVATGVKLAGDCMSRKQMRDIIVEYVQNKSLFNYHGLSIFDLDAPLKALLEPSNSCMHVDDLDFYIDGLIAKEPTEEPKTCDAVAKTADEEDLRSKVARLEKENKDLQARNKELKVLFVDYVKDRDPSTRSNKYLFLLLDKL